MSDLEHNKKMVARVFEVIYGDGSKLDEVEDMMAEDYINNNPMADGKAGFRHFFTNVIPLPLTGDLSPEGTISVNMIAEGDMVVRQELRKNGMLIDIYRIKDGLLQEHWDAFRPAEGYDSPKSF
jgi:predicted SnoaL-like aldol condensation-catalyzing enzyme